MDLDTLERLCLNADNLLVILLLARVGAGLLGRVPHAPAWVGRLARSPQLRSLLVFDALVFVACFLVREFADQGRPMYGVVMAFLALAGVGAWLDARRGRRSEG